MSLSDYLRLITIIIVLDPSEDFCDNFGLQPEQLVNKITTILLTYCGPLEFAFPQQVSEFEMAVECFAGRIRSLVSDSTAFLLKEEL